MVLSPSPQDVLAARSDLPSLVLDVANDLYRTTWQVSHVRLVELVPNARASLELLLAYALEGNPAGGVPMEEWLTNVEFVKSTSESLAELVKGAIFDMEQEKRWPNVTLESALRGLAPESAVDIFEIQARTERRSPCAPFECGPTYQVFWGSASHLYLLQIHNES